VCRFDFITQELGLPFTYYSHADMDRTGPDFIAPNRGDEAHGFLRFIIDAYDSLPAVSVFLHDDAWPHHQPRMTELLKCLMRYPDLPFTPLTDYWRTTPSPLPNSASALLSARFV
jgi:hypothetical protein